MKFIRRLILHRYFRYDFNYDNEFVVPTRPYLFAPFVSIAIGGCRHHVSTKLELRGNAKLELP